MNGADGMPLLTRVRRLFLLLLACVLVVEIVEWFDAVTPYWPHRAVSALGLAAAGTWGVALTRRGRPAWWLDAALTGMLVPTGWGLGRNGAVLALLLGAALLRAMFGSRRSVAVATAAMVAGYVVLTYLTDGLDRVVDLGMVTVAVALAAIVTILRLVVEAMAWHDLSSAYDRTLTRCAERLLTADTATDVEQAVRSALEELRRGATVAGGGLVDVPDIPCDPAGFDAAVQEGAPIPSSLGVKLGRLAADARLARERLESEQRYRQLAERSRDGIYVRSLQDPDRLLYLNPAGRQLFAERSGRPPDMAAALSLVSPEHRQLVRAAISDGGYLAEAVQVRIGGDEAEPGWIEVEEVPLERGAETSTVLGTIRDVTRRHLQEAALRDALRRQDAAAEELRRVDELRTMFLSAVSHELRTPLATVVGSSQTLVHHHDRLSADQAGALVAAVHRQASRLQRLLDDLLDVERLSRGLIAPERRPTSLRRLVDEVIVVLGPDAAHVRVGGVDVTVNVDAPKVERIVDNLLRNALKHTPPGTPIVVETHPHPVGAMIVVEDEGPGIPPALHDQVFEPFVQGPESRTAASPGTGIGLALVGKFAELHGGRAWAEMAEGGGARLIVLLGDGPVDPLAADRGAPPAALRETRA